MEMYQKPDKLSTTKCEPQSVMDGGDTLEKG